ncbi:MAG: hypothetical protein CMI31_12430 [Opitutae bacterium]|nr:hypothetical protein [Opitutae bacterium]|tara:strand:- start:589 stop:837 length:249 start_codon:yes stop_codon:yes gene_type:complete
MHQIDDLTALFFFISFVSIAWLYLIVHAHFAMNEGKLSPFGQKLPREQPSNSFVVINNWTNHRMSGDTKMTFLGLIQISFLR